MHSKQHFKYSQPPLTLIAMLAIVCLTCLAWSFSVQALPSTESAASTGQDIEFTVKPVTCIVLNSGDICHLKAHFSWQLHQESDVCLWQEQHLLQCWKNSINNKHSVEISIDKSTLFYLKNQQGDLFAQQSINLNSQTNKRYRRRLHSDWSLF